MRIKRSRITRAYYIPGCHFGALRSALRVNSLTSLAVRGKRAKGIEIVGEVAIWPCTYEKAITTVQALTKQKGSEKPRCLLHK
jgi:hypothetical protein